MARLGISFDMSLYSILSKCLGHGIESFHVSGMVKVNIVPFHDSVLKAEWTQNFAVYSVYF